jgi:hypothetical protein
MYADTRIAAPLARLFNGVSAYVPFVLLMEQPVAARTRESPKSG